MLLHLDRSILIEYCDMMINYGHRLKYRQAISHENENLEGMEYDTSVKN